MPAGTGSRTNFLYVSDSGQSYILPMDKSNAASPELAFGVPPTTNLELAHQGGRQGTVARYVNCYRITAAGQTVKRKFPVGTLGAFNSLKVAGSPTVTVSGFLYFVTSLIGEKKFVPSIIDTGLTDPAAP